MICTLMHKRLAVAALDLDEATGSIQHINTVYTPEHLPVGTCTPSGEVDRAALNQWWTGRCIPTTRIGIREALEALGLSSPQLLPLRSYGLSLSDHYWICPQDAGVIWDTINFYDNPFSDNVGSVLFGQPKPSSGFDFCSPDNTTDGYLRKCWKIVDGARCLIKGGSAPFQQQPFNEVIATGIMERLNIPHVPYRLLWSNGQPYSVCTDFVTPDTELVTAWQVMQTQKKSNSQSVYQHFISCCQALGVDNVVPALDQMLVVDYLLANEDRHLNNFSLLRNPETLEWLGMAPIFDSGTSLGYDRTAERVPMDHDVVCKPFKNHHDQQLKLVSSLDWVDFEALSDLDELVRDTLSGSLAQGCVGADRIEAIAQAVQQRVQLLHQAAQSQQSPDLSSTADDVEQNVAQSYQ